MAADAPPHFVKRMTGSQERQCSLKAMFQQIRGPLQSGHGGSPPNTHYCIIYAEVNRTTIPRIKANRVMSLRLWTMGSSVPQRLVCGPTLDKWDCRKLTHGSRGTVCGEARSCAS